MPPKKRPKEDESEEDQSDEDFEISFSEEEDDEYDPEDTSPPKRSSAGRGRPRKTPLRKGRGRKRGGDSDEDMDEEYQPTKRPRGRPKKATKSEESMDDDDDENFKPTKKKTPAKKAPVGRPPKKTEPKNTSLEDSEAAPPTLAKASSKTDWSQIDLSSDAKTKDDKPWTHKFSSWNVNGIRAWLKSDGLEYIKQECPDIFCLQETKCSDDDLPQSEIEVPGYHSYWYSADQKGYSGTGIYCKEEPINVTRGIGIAKHDNEGRAITVEFEKYYFVTAYVPNAGDKLKRLDYRVKEWDPDFRSYLQSLDKVKPVIICGDLNVAHNEIDIANPKSNQKSAGFTKQERESFTTLLTENKLIDTFRSLYPDKKDAYSYWSYRSNARANNKGWRLDYFLISERLQESLCDSVIRTQVYGSDHCPIVLLLAL